MTKTCRTGAVRLAVGLILMGACRQAPTGVQAQSPGQSPDLPRELAAVQRDNQQVERLLDLARGTDFYLTLAPQAGSLTLMLKGAELQRYAVFSVQVGRPRVAWMRRDTTAGWQETIWSGGTLEPPRQIDRMVVRTEEPAKEGEEPKPPPIPPTAEELYPVPSQYHIRFTGGLSIEVRPHEADPDVGAFAAFWAWWGARWRDARSALGSTDRDTVRLRLVLEPADAMSLYRALPPSTRLIVLSGDPDGSVPATGPPAK